MVRLPMFRAVLLLLVTTSVLAEKVIKTSALLPCQVNSKFSARKFDVKLHPDQNKVSLDVELSSAIDGNFTVEAELLVYGIKALSEKISGCDISKTICPISPGRFDVQTDLDLPKDIISKIPGIAYNFPDIDAVVQAKIYYVDENGNKRSNDPIGCVIAQLSNDKTVQHSYVSWILFAIIMIGVIVSGFAVFGGHTTTASHIISNTVSLFSYFQSTAIIGMMAVARMPPIASAWVQNFEWTMGIISVGFMQNAITWYVRATGGTETTILENKNQVSVAVYKRAAEDLYRRSAIDFYKAQQDQIQLHKRANLVLSSNVTTTNERDNELLGKTLIVQGIKRVAYLANIEIANLFTTGAAFFVFIGILIVLLMTLFKLFLELLIRCGALRESSFADYRANFRSLTKGTMFRYFYVGFTQLSLLCLYEFTARESAATVVIACVMFAVLLITLLVAATKVIALGHKSKAMFKNPASILFGNPEVLHRWGFLYVQYNAAAYYFLIIALVHNFAKSAVIALGQSNGKAQSVVFFAIEVIYLICLCVIRPYMDKTTNAYNIAISVFSIVNAIFFMFFSQLFGEKASIASAIIGVVYFIMNAILTLVFLILIIVACLMAILHPHPDTRYKPVTDDRNLFIPDPAGEKDETELDDLRMAASDGYRHSYLSYDPDKGQQNLGAVRKTPSGQFHEASAPEMAMRNSRRYGDDNIQSFRDIQSRGVLTEPPEHYYGRQDERLI